MVANQMNSRQLVYIASLFLAFYLILVQTGYTPDIKLFDVQIAGFPPYAITLTMFTLLIALMRALGRVVDEVVEG